MKLIPILVLGLCSALAGAEAPTTDAAADAAEAAPAESRLEAARKRIAAAVAAAEGLEPKVAAFVRDVLLPHSADAALLAAVQAQNEAGLTLEQIQADDATWKAAEDPTELMLAMITGPTADALTAFADAQAAVTEVFAMDGKGANVAQNLLTSDYWQGDEAKFTASFADGVGGIQVGELELDASTNAVQQQISLPIFRSDGVAVGAITYGVDISKL